MSSEGSPLGGCHRQTGIEPRQDEKEAERRGVGEATGVPSGDQPFSLALSLDTAADASGSRGGIGADADKEGPVVRV